MPEGTPAAATNMQAPLWRAIALFRFASLGYAALLLALRRAEYAHWALAWVVLAVMAGWTVATTIAWAAPARRTRWLLAADLVVTAAALLSTGYLQNPHFTAAGAMPLTATWTAGPALAWAAAGGAWAGAAAAAVLGGCEVALRGQSFASTYRGTALDGPIALLLAGIAVGYIATLTARAEQAVQRAAELEAASRERERLARAIHDSVLQVLALVHRRGVEAGGEAAELGRLAGEQESALRALISPDGGRAAPAGELDLGVLLQREASTVVSVITPGASVLLDETVAAETAAAVRAALDNVRQHCGGAARAWVLVDDEGAQVSVTIRDDGPGIPPGRLAEAAAEGRLGVRQAICGRIRDIGGSAEVISTPGGTEVRLMLPRARLRARVTKP